MRDITMNYLLMVTITRGVINPNKERTIFSNEHKCILMGLYYLYKYVLDFKPQNAIENTNILLGFKYFSYYQTINTPTGSYNQIKGYLNKIRLYREFNGVFISDFVSSPKTKIHHNQTVSNYVRNKLLPALNNAIAQKGQEQIERNIARGGKGIRSNIWQPLKLKGIALEILEDRVRLLTQRELSKLSYCYDWVKNNITK